LYSINATSTTKIINIVPKPTVNFLPIEKLRKLVNILFEFEFEADSCILVTFIYG
jgi:hypothetical protein